jgi:uridylate kinase
VKVVIKLGGFAFQESINSKLLSEYAKEIKKLCIEGHSFLIVTGGGKNARRYIQASRDLGASEAFCDKLGIQVSRLNALLLLSSLWDYAYRRVPSTLEEAVAEFKEGYVVIMGGLQPGQSTNGVAALAAELVRADILINLTDVKGVFTQDPNISRDAEFLEAISIKQFEDIIAQKKYVAGGYKLFDPLALKVIERSKIRTIIASGQDSSNLEKIIRNQKVGTEIIIEEKNCD